MTSFHFGTQSWRFRAWVGSFYPPNTKTADMLGLYGRMFSSTEVDLSFYALPAAPILLGWREKVPDDFVFALKVPQQITHSKRLTGVAAELQHFVDRIRQLETALGPVLVQLPPDFIPTVETRSTLDSFLSTLPEDIRWSVEFKHPAWLGNETLSMLRERKVALTLVDGRWVKRAKMLEFAADPTADFCYVRWMGLRKITDVSRHQLDREKELAACAEVLKSLPGSVDTVYGYFNNQFQGHSPHSARAMQRLVGQQPVEPLALRTQAELVK